MFRFPGRAQLPVFLQVDEVRLLLERDTGTRIMATADPSHGWARQPREEGQAGRHTGLWDPEKPSFLTPLVDPLIDLHTASLSSLDLLGFNCSTVKTDREMQCLPACLLRIHVRLTPNRRAFVNCKDPQPSEQ